MPSIETQTRIQTVSAFRWQRVVMVLASVIVLLAFYFDAAAQSWIATHRTESGLALMEQVSRWGDWPAHVVLGLVLVAIAYARRERRWLRIFVAMLVACALAGTAARVIKISAGRARPSVEEGAGWNGPRLGQKYHAFPSGHAASSTGFFAALAFASWRHGGPLLVIPLLIAFSRMYVAAHHLSDVVCAALLGAVVAWLVTRSRLLTISNQQSEMEN